VPVWVVHVVPGGAPTALGLLVFWAPRGAPQKPPPGHALDGHILQDHTGEVINEVFIVLSNGAEVGEAVPADLMASGELAFQANTADNPWDVAGQRLNCLAVPSETSAFEKLSESSAEPLSQMSLDQQAHHDAIAILDKVFTELGEEMGDS
jgi:hypothetical protein